LISHLPTLHPGGTLFLNLRVFPSHLLAMPNQRGWVFVDEVIGGVRGFATETLSELEELGRQLEVEALRTQGIRVRVQVLSHLVSAHPDPLKPGFVPVVVERVG
jgi:hypothetical protein